MTRKRLFSASFRVFLCPVLLALSVAASAQQLDVALGMNTTTAPSGNEASGNHFPQSLTGGLYPSFSADAVLFRNFGVQGEFAWRGGRGDWLGVQPYRPFFYDFNAMYLPKIADRAYMELLAGLGAQSTRFYQATQVCDPYSCRNYVTINHFMGHFGAGLKLYATHNFFVRPEAHLYLVNDNQEFSSGRVVRYGVSVGYTFSGR